MKLIYLSGLTVGDDMRIAIPLIFLCSCTEQTVKQNPKDTGLFDVETNGDSLLGDSNVYLEDSGPHPELVNSIQVSEYSNWAGNEPTLEGHPEEAGLLVNHKGVHASCGHDWSNIGADVTEPHLIKMEYHLDTQDDEVCVFNIGYVLEIYDIGLPPGEYRIQCGDLISDHIDLSQHLAGAEGVE